MYFDCFGIEYILQKVLNKIKDKSVSHIIFRIQPDDCIMCEFYCICFLEQINAGKTFVDYANLFLNII